MHESERHRVILATIESRPVATVSDLVEITGTSEATIRRDIAALHIQGKLHRVRGGAESLNPPGHGGLAGRPFHINESKNVRQKRAIARAAVEMCHDGESIIINGGTTTLQMLPHLVGRRMQVFTNSFPIADYLLRHSKITVLMPGGTIYREQNIILSPFDSDVSRNYAAGRMFMGVQGIGPLGLMEADPLVVQAELKLMGQADELVVLADSSKFRVRSSMILCPLQQAHTIITDSGLRDEDRAMIEEAGVRLIVVDPESAAETGKVSAA